MPWHEKNSINGHNISFVHYEDTSAFWFTPHLLLALCDFVKNNAFRRNMT